MKTNYLFYFLLIFGSIMVWWILNETFSQPGVEDLHGDYEEIGKYRNENNTGPVLRIYAVNTSDTLWNDMKSYGDFMPHTKYGNTKVFFFINMEVESLDVSPEPPFLDPSFQQFCIGKYEKSAMGEVNFIKYPFE